MIRRALGTLLAVAVFFLAEVAEAASRVVLVRPPRPDVTAREATTRLEAEIRSAGFDVVVIDGVPGLDARTQVERARLEPRVFATIAILNNDHGTAVDVWIADHLSEKTVVRRLDVSDAGKSGAASTLAVRAVELLRASLLELEGDAPAVPLDVARFMVRVAPPTAPVPTPEPRPSLASPVPDLFAAPVIEVAGAVLQSTGGLGTAVGPMLRLTHPAPLGMLVRLSMFGDLAHPKRTGSGGHVSFGQEYLAIHAARVLGAHSVLRPIVSVGVGIHHLRAQGVGDAGYQGRTGSTTSFLADAGAGLAVRLGARAAIEADVHALFLAPQPAIHVAGEDIGRVGIPMIQASLGVVIAP